MTKQALLVDLDNTAYGYNQCHADGLAESWRYARSLDSVWQSEARFLSDYEAAKGIVKRRVGKQASAHSRLLYFKQLLEDRLAKSQLAEAAALADRYWAGFAGQLHPDPDCVDVLREFKEDVAIAWVSNYTTMRQIWKLQRLGLLDIADYLITSEEAGAEKPDPRPIHLALEKLGISRENAFVIGDSAEDDIAGARSCGLRCALLVRDGQDVGVPDGVSLARSWGELREVVHDWLHGRS